jgi:hypothetical protein
VTNWTPIATSFATGAAALGGIGLGSWLNANNTRKQTRHKERLETAGAFVAKISGTIHSLEYAIDHPDDEKARDNTQHFLGQSSDLLGPVQLLFDGRIQDLAESTTSNIATAVDAVKNRDTTLAQTHLQKARDAQRGLIARASKVLDDG